MEYQLSDNSTCTHLMQAVQEHVGAQTQEFLRYKFLGVPPLTAMEFLNVDIRALLVLSNHGWQVKVTQLDPPRIEALPTASHKKKHRDNYLDKGSKGKDGERRVWKWGGGRLELIEEGGKVEGGKVEQGEEAWVRVKTEGEHGGGHGGGHGKEKKKVVKTEEDEVIDLVSD
ncbi:hypothetical protein HK104_007371 [Borealophlyctis nickersoniae]|nr:hypothetical protein HK104_007371 [Borealophlyctis nickersoniae]